MGSSILLGSTDGSFAFHLGPRLCSPSSEGVPSSGRQGWTLLATSLPSPHTHILSLCTHGKPLTFNLKCIKWLCWASLGSVPSLDHAMLTFFRQWKPGKLWK